MQLLISSYLFFIGLACGSFALVLVDRMKSHRNWVTGRSECEHCHHVLHVKDLVPLFSWIAQRGKCRYCSKKLSSAYPLVELMTAIVFVASYIYFPYELSGVGIVLLVLWLLCVVIGVALFVFDIRWFLLPTKLVYGMAAFALAHRIVYMLMSQKPMADLYLELGLSLLIGAGFFLLLHVLSNGKWIGDGDVRLGLVIGLLAVGPIEAWLVICIASFIGVLAALKFVATRRNMMKAKIAFGPPLLAAIFIVYMWGSALIAWYSNNFLYLQ